MSTHATPCLFLGVGKGFLTNLWYFPKIAKRHMVLFLFSTLIEGDASLDALAVASVPPVYATSQLDEGILCVLSSGKTWLW